MILQKLFVWDDAIKIDDKIEQTVTECSDSLKGVFIALIFYDYSFQICVIIMDYYHDVWNLLPEAGISGREK